MYGVRWQRDTEECTLCSCRFTFLRRRHHCRSCGRLVCGKCSRHRLLNPNTETPERACDLCAVEQARTEVSVDPEWIARARTLQQWPAMRIQLEDRSGWQEMRAEQLEDFQRPSPKTFVRIKDKWFFVNENDAALAVGVHIHTDGRFVTDGQSASPRLAGLSPLTDVAPAPPPRGRMVTDKRWKDTRIDLSTESTPEKNASVIL